MPTTMLNVANIAANTKTANQLAGDINEFVSNGGLVKVYAVSSAAGVRLQVYADGDIAVDDKEIIAIGTTLSTQDHFLDAFEVLPGSRLGVFLRETAGVATTDVLLRIDVE